MHINGRYYNISTKQLDKEVKKATKGRNEQEDIDNAWAMNIPLWKYKIMKIIWWVKRKLR
jgi:hypothetical protein